MRFSLVILACLATAFAADQEETTSASNSNIENGNDLSPTLFDEESGTNTFENSESSGEGQGLDLANETKNRDNEEAPIEEESETKAFENSETVDEDEGVGVRDEDESGDNEEMATEEESEPENSNKVDENVDSAGEDENVMATEEESEPENSNKVDENVDSAGEDENVMATEEESETETFENSETVDKDEGVDIVGKDENEDKVTEEESETEGEINQNNGKDEGAEDEGLPSSQEGDEDIPTQPETPVFNDITEAPAPTEVEAPTPTEVEAPTPTEVEAPTSDYAPTPTNAARTPFPTVYNPPSLRPALPYVSATDDPLEDEYNVDGDGYDDRFDWFAKDSETIEELEHDKTVIIALSVTFGVMVFFSIFVAFQLLENPDGCCASICRISVACWCGLLRCICYPCRAMCGCTGPSHGEHMMVPDDGRFTHDLELS